jgi:hypothetical protein
MALSLGHHMPHGAWAWGFALLTAAQSKIQGEGQGPRLGSFAAETARPRVESHALASTALGFTQSRGPERYQVPSTGTCDLRRLAMCSRLCWVFGLVQTPPPP